jgi:hypothetical protein
LILCCKCVFCSSTRRIYCYNHSLVR